jgi:3'(2'), 5'-bisphosphate nucleotidase
VKRLTLTLKGPQTLNHPCASELDIAIRAVADACSVTRSVQAQLDQIRQLTKDDRSPVTVADFAAQAIVAMTLRDTYSDVSLVGEESAADLRTSPDSGIVAAITHAVRRLRPAVTADEVLDSIDVGNHDASDNRYWTLDPVDGTKGFLRNGQYAVSLALIDNGEVVVGVLGCANLSTDYSRSFDVPDPTGCIYYASRGAGSWYLPADNIEAPPIRIQAAAEVSLDRLRVCESVEAAHSKQDDTQRILKHLKATSDPARLDSQCKYAVVGRGQADAYLRLPTGVGYVEKIWDHAAGMIVAQEAGAIVTDMYGRSLDFSKGATLIANQGIVCTAPAIHSQIVSAITTLGIGR